MVAVCVLCILCQRPIEEKGGLDFLDIKNLYAK